MAKYVYISGPVTGLEYEKAKAAFDDAAEQIRKLYGAAVVVVNPMDFIDKNEQWDYAMRKCIEQLMTCSYIHILPGSGKSKGARLEMAIARELGFGLCDYRYKFIENE